MKEQSDESGQTPPLFNTEGGKSELQSIEVPSIELPKGGGAIRGIGEKFSVNAVNGTAGFSVPLPVSPARGTVPQLSLQYSSGGGNSVFGLGWSMELASIKRKTSQELPQYFDAADSDTFLFSGAEDLVPEFKKTPAGTFAQDGHGKYVIRRQDSADGEFVITFYKPHTEGLFALIERWAHKATGETKWRVTTPENKTTLLGWSSNARIASPKDPRKVYEWLPEFIFDDQGNCTQYVYKPEDDTGFNPGRPHNANRRKNGQLTYTNRYPSQVLYGNKTPYLAFGDPFPAASDYMFELAFDYGEYDLNAPYAKNGQWMYRPDAFSDHKPGFEVRTTRLCRRVLLFHHFDELPGDSALVKSLNIEYNTATEQDFTFLKSVTTVGYIKQPNGTYTHKQLPPLEFSYQKHAWNQDVKNVSSEDSVHAPIGVTGGYTFTDLYGEGLSGILTERGGAWYYKRNLGNASFSRAKKVSPKPAISGLNRTVQLLDLDADGTKQIVRFDEKPAGFYELDDDNAWQRFRSFKQLPNINFQDFYTRLIDLTGDGKADLLITEDHILTWYESEGREGYAAPARKVPKILDEEQGPAVIFADSKQSVFLADMDGDGLTDIVRIRSGEVCYWPNLGYGRFGAKVAMDSPPVFDAPDAFNPGFIRLADIDGSGATDIIYLGKNTVTCWRNLSGNAFAAEPFNIEAFPEIHNRAGVTVTDLLGIGTMCLVWSSPLSKDAQAPLRYIDLMGGKKPHLMTGYQNNLGKEVKLTYTPSTRFYLEDERAGQPWVTKLHFPVQCVSQTETIDHITGHRFVSSYRYRHGYYDHQEREFRGFGMVEQTDAEQFEHWVKGGDSNIVEKALHQEPVITKQWYHTGAFLRRDKILTHFAQDYWHAEMERQGFAAAHNEHQLPDAHITAAAGLDPSLIDHLTGEEWQQALRACKNMPLRSEVFAYDAPETGATPAQLKLQLTPYAVETSNCQIELLQPKGQNKYAVFTVKEQESIAYSYERNTADPRIAHTLNTAFDEYGNILESASVVYARTQSDPALPAATQNAQAQTLITYKDMRFTNDVIASDTYRLRLPSEERTYELRGVAKTGDYFTPADFKNILTAATEVPYPQKDNNPPPGSPQKRLIEHLRSTYYKQDLSGPLPLHQLELRALPFETYQLAYTPDVLTDVFGGKATGAMLTEGKYVHSEGDSNWWVLSGTASYLNAAETPADAQNRFFMPTSYTDPLGAITKVSYLANFTFIASTEDALGNQTTVDQFNFRTLKPERMRDLNGNLSEVRFDELGLVKVMALLGKGGEADDLTGHTAHTTAAEADSIADFLEAATSSELTARGKVLLGQATTRFAYDLDAYQTSGQPAVAASIIREQHFADNSDSPIQLSFEYTNGLGELVMKKGQAEPGPAKQLTIAPDDSVTVTEVDTAPELRWVGTGRTIVNNKGNPVKKYQPYFSVTHRFEDNKQLVESRVTPLFYYDALDREVKMELPDGTFSKTEFTAWQHTLYDPGDTVKDSRWYHNRVNSLIDAELTAQGKDPLKEKLAAIASETYHGTPAVQHLDTLGRTILEIAHNRAGGSDEFYHSSAAIDIEGNLLSVTDARGNTVMSYKYDMLGQTAFSESMDGGQRWELGNILGENLRAWDERGHVFSYHYDILGRPLDTHVGGGDGETPLDHIFERIFYGENQPDAKAKNLRGQVFRYYDNGGLSEAGLYDFKGQPIANRRRLFADYKSVANWTDANLEASLEPETFTSATSRDALGRTLENTAPDGSITRTAYNQAGLLESKTVIQDAPPQTIVENIDYNEHGHRTRIMLGNGVSTTYNYDEQTFNLIRATTKKAGGETLQNLAYTYDAVGNVTHIEDHAVPVQFFNNQLVTGITTYTYDAVYRLTQAAGRENNAGLAFGPQDNWDDGAYTHNLDIGDPASIRTYTQTYAYDPTGNIQQMKHQAPGNTWTRDYAYQANNNRLASTTVGAQTYTYAHHPQHGFITAMPHLEELGWNFKEKLVRTVRQKAGNGTPETTYYQYSADGQRLRKITELAAAAGETPAKKDERIYLGNYERYQKHSGEHNGLIRHSLEISDDTARIALIETRNGIDDGTEPRLARYQLSNHQGSVNLEVNETAQIITYEEYHPFGTTAYRAANKAVKAAVKRYRYAGQERDQETGLAAHGARYYIPWLGRWLSADPGGLSDGLNLYRYARNNPGSLRDVNGNETDEQKASRMFEDFLNEQGVNYKKEVSFRVEVDGEWVDGRADFMVETDPGTWEPVEMKGKADSKWTRAQKKYLPALQAGAKWETRGKSKFKSPVSGSGGGKVFNVHTVAKGKFQFQKLFKSTVIKRPQGDPSKGEKITVTKDKDGNVVERTSEPDTRTGTRSKPKPKTKAKTKPKVKTPKAKGPKVKGKGIIAGLVVAGGVYLFTGDAEAAAQSVNPAAETTEAVSEGGGVGDVAAGGAEDLFYLTPPGAVVGIALSLWSINQAAMEASHFPAPEGWNELMEKEGRNSFCALCHDDRGPGSEAYRERQRQKEMFQGVESMFDEEGDQEIIRQLLLQQNQ